MDVVRSNLIWFQSWEDYGAQILTMASGLKKRLLLFVFLLSDGSNYYKVPLEGNVLLHLNIL